MCHSKVAVRQKVALLVLSVLTKEALSAQFVPQGNIQLQMPLFAQNAAQDQYQLRLPQVAISVLLENTLVTVNVFPAIPESSLRKGQRIVPSAPPGRLLPLLEAHNVIHVKLANFLPMLNVSYARVGHMEGQEFLVASNATIMSFLVKEPQPVIPAVTDNCSLPAGLVTQLNQMLQDPASGDDMEMIFWN